MEIEAASLSIHVIVSGYHLGQHGRCRSPLVGSVRDSLGRSCRGRFLSCKRKVLAANWMSGVYDLIWRRCLECRCGFVVAAQAPVQTKIGVHEEFLDWLPWGS